MKKKISLLGLVLILVLSLAGCGSKTKEATEYDQATMEQCIQMVVGTFSQLSEEQLDVFKDSSEYELNYTLMNARLPIAADDFLAMIDAWNAGISECGEFTEIGEFEMEVKNGGPVLTAPFTATERSGKLEFTFDEKMNMESMTVNATYSMGEILKKAGLNTILGMGTVFAVLIFIAFIISLFRYIPVIQEKFSKKNKKAESKPAPVPAATPVVAVPAATDNGELIAVIAAAIAAAEGTSTDGFIVRSIKRRKSNKWN